MPVKSREAPQRTCIACGAESSKSALVRLVRRADGEVQIDRTGKLSGRGAYVCPKERCLEVALKKDKLEHSLKTHIAPANIISLRASANLIASGGPAAYAIK